VGRQQISSQKSDAVGIHSPKSQDYDLALGFIELSPLRFLQKMLMGGNNVVVDTQGFV
jgi:hypothetical protein